VGGRLDGQAGLGTTFGRVVAMEFAEGTEETEKILVSSIGRARAARSVAWRVSEAAGSRAGMC